MQLITAQLTGPARRVTTKHGNRTVADAIDLTTGETFTIWRPEGDRLLNLAPNTRVTLTKDSKGKVSLVDNTPTEPAPVAPVSTDVHKLNPDQKRDIASYIQQQRDLLAFCWQEASRIPGPTEEAVIEKLAVTLYLSAQRRFDLA